MPFLSYARKLTNLTSFLFIFVFFLLILFHLCLYYIIFTHTAMTFMSNSSLRDLCFIILYRCFYSQYFIDIFVLSVDIYLIIMLYLCLIISFVFRAYLSRAIKRIYIYIFLLRLYCDHLFASCDLSLYISLSCVFCVF